MKVAEVISTENTCYVYRWNKLTDTDITRFIKYWRMCSGIEFNIPTKKVAAVVNALRCRRVIKGKVNEMQRN